MIWNPFLSERAMKALMREHKLVTGAFDSDNVSMSEESSEVNNYHFKTAYMWLYKFKNRLSFRVSYSIVNSRDTD